MDRIGLSNGCRRLRPLVAALGLATGAAMAATGADLQQLQTSALAASCAACHGTDGRPAAGSTMPPLAGLPSELIRQRMHAFRDGTQTATVMHQISKGYTTEQIDALAVWFAARTVTQ